MVMWILIANQDASFRLALRMFLQAQKDIIVVAEVTRTGDLLRDAFSFQPDLIFLDWNLPNIERFTVSGHQNKSTGTPSPNQVKAVLIASLHCIQSMPVIIVTGNHQEDILPVLYSGADEFFCAGEMPTRLMTILASVHSKHD